ncbi:hypothetical protein P691DRAFT_791926 [Macrolepiota fuliginosa MF-IS2]|uniref:Uncharacterized protein n=1 Tax=Macrolepiota fuliginosa MF-IS2 TaxID=1400762 RepID=A0A9P5X1J0_9AGAR|nr:hypothetical protein P691DRAFT_791926 [Macrolepiota fuliginosa MF-IS2]
MAVVTRFLLCTSTPLGPSPAPATQFNRLSPSAHSYNRVYWERTVPPVGTRCRLWQPRYIVNGFNAPLSFCQRTGAWDLMGSLLVGCRGNTDLVRLWYQQAGPTLDHASPGPGSSQSGPEQLEERGTQVQRTWAHKRWGDRELAIDYMQATVRHVNVSSLHGVFGFLTSCGVHGWNNLGTPTRGNKELDCVALRYTTNPLSVPLPRSITKSPSDQPQDGTCLPTLRFFLRV